MTDTTQKPTPKELYIFSLPDLFLSNLQLRKHTSDLLLPTTSGTGETLERDQTNEEQLTSLGCSTCRISTFGSVAFQRAHFKSDWHRYNLKKPSKPINEDQFDKLLEDLDGSISGSDSSLSSSGSSAASSSLHDGLTDHEPATAQNSPVAWFTLNSLQTTQYGFYKTILPSLSPKAPLDHNTLTLLKRLQLTPIYPASSKKDTAVARPTPTDPESRLWAIFMVGGGHFAGMIVSLVPKYVKQSGRLEKEVIILESKTFHRYTTRRKQGGSQSINDQAKSKAKSAGAQIRRYNEQALQEDIRALLKNWRHRLKLCELVFMRTSKANSRIFYNYDETPFERQDSRMRSIPFPTRRPTLSELQRVFDELTKMKISYLSEEMLETLHQEYLTAQAKKLRITKPAITTRLKILTASPLKLSDQEIQERNRWERVLSMTARNKIDTFLAFLEKRSIEAETDFTNALPWYLEEARTTPTLLHYAALHNAAEIIRYLLLDLKADPTISHYITKDGLEISTKTPYELASSRLTRNVFRRCMADHPTLWDWQVARIPSGLTEEQEIAQRDKDRERMSRLRDRQREREKDKATQLKLEEEEINERAALERQRQLKAEEQKKLSSPNVPQKLGGQGSKYLAARAQETTAGMSEEQKMRLERERRARAAEARLSSRA